MKTNRVKHKIRPPTQADLGLESREAGKGDKDRTSARDAFRENYLPAEGVEGLQRRGSKLVKVYGGGNRFGKTIDVMENIAKSLVAEFLPRRFR